MASSREFTFLTINIDCAVSNWDERVPSLLQEIKNKSPDVIVIQELTRLSAEKIIYELKLEKYNKFIPTDSLYTKSDSEIIFSKFPLTDAQFIQYKQTGHANGITLVKLDLRDDNIGIWVCTSRFDRSVAIKREQFKSIDFLLKDIPYTDSIIFGCDTGLLDYQTFVKFPEGWEDSWYEAGTSDNKYTIDSEINLLVPPPFKDRPDRVYIKNGEKVTLSCEDCVLFGTENIPTISSHFGVLVTISY